ncbi:MAG: hypothetical protein EBR82_27400 [Caulobacteraceae bacterium]|nr:hypothetical protein [Caulobacteraceae bacterium]
MTDAEALDDEIRAKAAQMPDREYAAGWRAYVAGSERPTTHFAAKGWNEARYAAEDCWRPVLWSKN